MTDKPKLLWHSNAPWAPTGYGNQTGLFCPELAEHYDVRISSFYGLEGAPLVYDGIKVLPGVGNSYGNESLAAHAQQFFGGLRDGLLFTLLDVWVLDTQLMSRFDACSWVPVDHDPTPPRVRRFFAESGAVPIAMSRFGEEQLQEFEPLYVPHAVDCSTFKPYGRDAARERFDISKDEFIVGMVAANKGNPSRKSFVAALQAFAELRKQHSDAVLYLHTELEGKAHGVPLEPVVEALGIPAGALRVTSQYALEFEPTPPKLMAALYSAFDVLLAPSTGEGFGIPIMEAQACGVPVIVTDFSAMQEVCGSGWKVEYSRIWTPQQSWQAMPHVSDIYEALRHCYQLAPAVRKQLADKARGHAKQYDRAVVLEQHLLPALTAVRERFEERKPISVKPKLRVVA